MENLTQTIEEARIIPAEEFLRLYPQRGRRIPLPEFGLNLYVISRCLCLGDQMQSIYPVMPDGKIPYLLAESYDDDDDLLLEHINASIERLPATEAVRVGDIAPLASLWSAFNLAHWTLQALPKFFLLDRFGFSGSYVTNRMLFAVETLDWFGLPAARWLPMNAVYQADSVWLIDRLKFEDVLGNERLFGLLRNSLRERTGVLPGKRRLYLHRPEPWRRRPVNDDEVQALLRGYDFEVFTPDAHNVAEQFRALTNSSFTVTGHSASVVLALVQPERSGLLEFFSPAYITQCFSLIAERLKLLYLPLTVAETRDGYQPHDHYTVNCQLLKCVIEGIFSHTRGL